METKMRTIGTMGTGEAFFRKVPAYKLVTISELYELFKKQSNK